MVEPPGREGPRHDPQHQRPELPQHAGRAQLEIPQEGADREVGGNAGGVVQPGDQHRAEEPGHADGHERDPPAVDLLQVPAQQEAEHAAQRDAGREDAHRHGTAPPGEVVRHQRRGRRAVRRLAHAHRGAADEELAEALHQPAQEGEGAPEADAPGDHRPPGAQVAQHAERERGDREDQDVGGAEPAELRVREREVALDRLEQRVDDVAVDVVEQVDERQQPEGVPAVPARHRRAAVSAPPAPGCMWESDSSARSSRNASAARYSSTSRAIIASRRP